MMERPGMAQTQSEKPPTPARQTGPTSPERDPAESKNEQNAGSDSDPIAILRADHRHVEQLFGSFEKASSAEQKSHLAKQICIELTIHTLIEEEIFYPACHANMEQRLLDEAQVEHDGAKALIIEIRAGSPDDQYFQAKVKVLSEDIKHVAPPAAPSADPPRRARCAPAPHVCAADCGRPRSPPAARAPQCSKPHILAVPWP